MTRRRAAAMAVVLAMTAASVLVGCGGGDGDSRGGGSGRGTDVTETTDPGAAAYEGLTKRAAIAKADASDTPWRITREDDEQLMVTQDYVPDRLNFEIDDGTVTRATYG